MIRTAFVLFAVAASVSASAGQRTATDEAKLEKRLAGLTAGKPQDCITPSPSQGSEHYGNVLLFRDRFGDGLYRTHFVGGCIATDTDALFSRRPTNRLCRGEIMEIRDPVSRIPRGACSIGPFVRYRK